MTNVPITPQLAFIESPMQLLLIFGIIFVLFGAKKMPSMAKDIGTSIRIFKRSLSGENGEEEIPGNRELVTCGACGTSLLPGNKFCAECGHPLEKKIETPSGPASPGTNVENSEKTAVKKPARKKRNS